MHNLSRRVVAAVVVVGALFGVGLAAGTLASDEGERGAAVETEATLGAAPAPAGQALPTLPAEGAVPKLRDRRARSTRGGGTGSGSGQGGANTGGPGGNTPPPPVVAPAPPVAPPPPPIAVRPPPPRTPPPPAAPPGCGPDGC